MSSHLLRQKRFLPFFGTQALGACNDNIFKNALVILIAYSGISLLGMEQKELTNFAFGLFIIPFFLYGFANASGNIVQYLIPAYSFPFAFSSFTNPL